MNKYFLGLRGVFSPLPTYLIFYVTARCNARCRMCFYWQEIDGADKTKELNLEEIDRISRSFGFLEYATLTGGEPTLRDDLPAIARIFDRNNQVQFLSIPTNSILVDKIKSDVEEILKTVKHPYLKMCLSLDGLGDDHDKIRGVKGCFEKVVANYQNLVKLKKQVKDFEIMINLTVSAFNYQKVGEVMNFVRQEMPEAVFDVCWTRGNPRDSASKTADADIYRQIIDLVGQDQRNFSSGFVFSRLMAANKRLAKETIYQILKTGQRHHHCVAGKKMLIISERGEVKPCEILDFSFGNLREYNYDIKKILVREEIKKVLKFIKDKQCVCTFENAIQNSLVNNPANWRQLILKLIKPF